MNRRGVVGGLLGLIGGILPGTSRADDPDLRRVIGQLLLVGFDGAEPGQPVTRQLLQHITAGRAGGVLLLNRNIRDRAQVRRLTSAIRKAGGPGMLIAADQEGGAVQRLGPRAGFGMVPGALAVARGGGADFAQAVYARMASDLADVGVNMNLGPVLDLSLVGRGVIGGLGRGYSADPDVVAELAGLFIQAHARAGIITVAKHFPGHGSTTIDSHRRLPNITATWKDRELAPYRVLINDGQIPTVMTAHLYHPRFSDRPGWPSSLSNRTTRELRDGLGFEGPIITDDLGMEAVSQAAGSVETAAVRALLAGADMLILSNHPNHDPGLIGRVHTAISNAVSSGELPRVVLEAAHRRVTGMKARWLG